MLSNVALQRAHMEAKHLQGGLLAGGVLLLAQSFVDLVPEGPWGSASFTRGVLGLAGMVLLYLAWFRSTFGFYGVAVLEGHRITAMLEKPEPDLAPSRLALCGRYVFPSTTKEVLQRCSYEEHGDLQSIAIQHHWMNQRELYGFVLEDTQWYDAGSPMKWLQAQVDHALRRDDLSPAFSAWLHERMNDQR